MANQIIRLEVRDIQHHDVVCSGILVDKFLDKSLREWTKQPLVTLEEGIDSCMFEVIAASLF